MGASSPVADGREPTGAIFFAQTRTLARRGYMLEAPTGPLADGREPTGGLSHKPGRLRVAATCSKRPPVAPIQMNPDACASRLLTRSGPSLIRMPRRQGGHLGQADGVPRFAAM